VTGATAALLVVVVVALIASALSGGGGKITNVTGTSQAPVMSPTIQSTPTPRPPTTTATAPTTATPTPMPAFTVKEQGASVRDGPDTVYQVIGTLRQGEAFEITGRNQASDWWQFTYNGKPAWVSNSVVNANRQAADAPMVAAPPTPPSSPGIGSTMVSDKDDMTLIYVPAGEFLMGSVDSDGEADSDEKPQHKVYLDAFWIDRTEVTNAQYRKCVEAKACQPPSQSSSYTRSSYYGNSQYDNYPVIYVSWHAAQQYCRWAGRRLPTEAEWEKAARGTDGRKYPWGDAAPDVQRANFNNNKGDTTAVGSYPSGASPYGALDMAGNVWEWTADWYNETYYSGSPAQNPQGPGSGSGRVLRGGSWYSVQGSVRAANRDRDVVDNVFIYGGFRCARSP
jgi:formylglycine-generating enzyme required for sulfatase activity